MTAVVKTLIPARPVGKELLSNIPFLDTNNPDVYSTRFQEDFQHFNSKKAEPLCQPSPAQVIHNNLKHKEYLTEVKMSYQYHPLKPTTCIPKWTTLLTNFKMQTDPKEVTFLSTQSQQYQPHPFQPPAAPIRPTLVTKNIQQEQTLSESTTQAAFIRHHSSPLVKATVKHLEGFPTIKGDTCLCNFVSQYNNTFQGAWGRAAQPVEKHSSRVPMGDPVKIVETQTTHGASFSHPTVCRQPVEKVKERVKLNLGNFSKDSWSSSSREAFCHHKLGDAVVRIKKNKNFSSLPKGDTDTKQNKEWMSVTTNRISFSDQNHSQRPVFVSGPDLMTKSHVQFNPPSLSGRYYTTTSKDDYSKRDGMRTRPVTQLPSNILSGKEQGLRISTTMADFVPMKTYKKTPRQSQNSRNNIRFPLAQQQFSTTTSESYTARPLIQHQQPPHSSQFITHFVLQ
ncbi:uncharacterized protein si:ch211-198o12.4 [Amphiprion ocellaris]|uniref:Uncharacterized protein n=1 Tax=Amphiprion ocellaris TaxID=80972 RepID=A0AAQ5YJI2_AMPOC|nr:uncharacterized protein si:ch211-198o12.4 [Amphiprion ocellaris]